MHHTSKFVRHDDRGESECVGVMDQKNVSLISLQVDFIARHAWIPFGHSAKRECIQLRPSYDGHQGGAGRYDRARQIKREARCVLRASILRSMVGPWRVPRRPTMGSISRRIAWPGQGVSSAMFSNHLSLMGGNCRYKPIATRRSTWMTWSG